MDLIQFDNFLVVNNMYSNTYYTKDEKRIFDNDNSVQTSEEEILENEMQNSEEPIKIYASTEELNIKYLVDVVHNFTNDERIGWSGNILENKNCKENIYNFYLRVNGGNYEKAVSFSY